MLKYKVYKVKMSEQKLHKSDSLVQHCAGLNSAVLFLALKVIQNILHVTFYLL